jgi:hypothetical protein
MNKDIYIAVGNHDEDKDAKIITNGLKKGCNIIYIMESKTEDYSNKNNWKTETYSINFYSELKWNGDLDNMNNTFKFIHKDSKIEKLGDSYVVVSYEFIKPKEFAKGGKIGFEGLANKVAKRYVRKKVSKEYQAEYGKTYDEKEAQEVGNKVAGKVYQQQVAKKKIVRKLQRKTN